MWTSPDRVAFEFPGKLTVAGHRGRSPCRANVDEEATRRCSRRRVARKNFDRLHSSCAQMCRRDRIETIPAGLLAVIGLKSR